MPDRDGRPIALDYRGAAADGSIARRGSRIVAPPNHPRLPERCVKTGRDADVVSCPRRQYLLPLWYKALVATVSVALVLLIVLSPRLGVRIEPLPVTIGLAIAAFLLGRRVRKHATLVYFLDRRVLRRRNVAARVLGVARLAVLLPMLAHALWPGYLLPWQAAFGLFGLLTVLFVLEARVEPLRLKHVTPIRAEYAGAGRAFLDALPAAPRQ